MLEQLISEIKTNWKDLINQFFVTHKTIYSRLDQLIKTRSEDNELIPKKELIFNAFNFFDYQKTKVVIIGQDPYADIKKANGLAFGVDNNKPPVSLRNIIKEFSNNLKLDEQQLDNFDYSLKNWANQGVLLINTILTVRKQNPLSDQNLGWEELIKFLIVKLLEEKIDPIFVLWGKKAQEFLEPYDLKHVLKSAHPSFFSAKQFFNNNHFNLINELLKSKNQQPIQWIKHNK
ncbi:uracil-DNA glycosylase [Mycoplasma tullyi]|uniref:Uracil-DNA glycosylase n=1 Tax=Mycoplasma tullyi TaxID=1612150 RepID=A0A7D7UDW1_9MOLU|nr:uracil-DNA glycosylase [Mycoplasma tullyi]QMT98446.1 uracil-DNA glycosylase [Mycoplasma tullyi]